MCVHNAYEKFTQLWGVLSHKSEGDKPRSVLGKPVDSAAGRFLSSWWGPARGGGEPRLPVLHRPLAGKGQRRGAEGLQVPIASSRWDRPKPDVLPRCAANSAQSVRTLWGLLHPAFELKAEKLESRGKKCVQPPSFDARPLEEGDSRSVL